jgi:molybdopterin converting factor small subunit
MRIRFYGRLADSMGRELELDVAGECSVVELRRRLSDEFPDAADAFQRNVRACVGDTIVADNHVLRTTDQVEFFPPVSGG